MSELVERIFAAFDSNGAAAYLGEPVTLREHMLQSAAAAEGEGAGEELVAAALLHDIGHLLHGGDEDAAEHGVDTYHEDVGFRFLEQRFPSSVVDPVRLHVAAKRYLVAVDPAYREQLSPASQLSLELQGGPMSAEETAAFEREPHWREACRLRRWDDLGKEPVADVPPLEHYRPVLEAVAISGS
jgi:[1-hydroxy-2-(trimethylamino)ethyl]phosphonate dioxygenase